MLKLKATKTSLYKLVGEFEKLPPMRRTQFTKAHRRMDYWLLWTDEEGLKCTAFLAAVGGRALMFIEKKEVFGPAMSRTVHRLEARDLLGRDMAEEEPLREQEGSH